MISGSEASVVAYWPDGLENPDLTPKQVEGFTRCAIAKLMAVVHRARLDT